MANFLKREDDAYSITVRLSSSSHFPNLLGPGEDRNPDLCLRRGVDFLRLVPLFTLIASHEPIRVLYGKEVSDLVFAASRGPAGFRFSRHALW